MSDYCIAPNDALAAAYTATPAEITGYATSPTLGVLSYKLIMTSAAWVSQGIPPTAFTVDHTTSIFTAVNHNLLPRTPVQVSNSGGALPTGLSAATTYYAVPIDANTFFLYDTWAHAFAGGATGKIAPSDNGTGTQSAQTIATKNAAGSAFVPASVYVDVDGAMGAQLSVVEDSAGGEASLLPVVAAR